MSHERCECHDCTQYRARLGLGGLGGMQSQIPPRCLKHGDLMVLSFYDRPGGPPGNGYVCPACVKERRNDAVAMQTPAQQ